MEEIIVPSDLGDILRETIDQCATFRRNIQIPKDLKERLKAGDLSEEETESINEYLCSMLLRVFLNAKESLILPEDGLEEIITDFIPNLDEIEITFAYQDFYAYQFVDKLNDIVHRALKVKDVFAKKRPPQNVTKICSEAYLSYLYGFYTASVSLIRSVIETMLKERLNVDVSTLGLLNDMARDRGIYENKIWDKVDRIRKEANTFVHEVSRGKTPSESKNLQLLGYAQEVLESLLACYFLKNFISVYKKIHTEN